MNYFPSLGFGDQWWLSWNPATSPSLVNVEVARATSIHANTVRLFVSYCGISLTSMGQQCPGGPPSPAAYGLSILESVLSAAHAAGVQVQLTPFFFAGKKDCSSPNQNYLPTTQQAEAYFTKVINDISGSGHAADVGSIDMFSEPEICSSPTNDMRFVSDMLSFYRSTLQGLGWFTTVGIDTAPAGLGQLRTYLGATNQPDFWTAHHYPGTSHLSGDSALYGFQQDLATIHPSPPDGIPQLPLHIGETGSPTSSASKWVPPGLPASDDAFEAYQDLFYREIELAARQAGLPVAAPFMLNDTSTAPSCPPADCASFGLFRVDGSAKPAEPSVATAFSGGTIDTGYNQGFEQGVLNASEPALWHNNQVDASTTWSRSTVTAHSGTASAAVTSAFQTSGPGCWLMALPLFATSPPRTYTLSVWVRTQAAPQTARAFIRFDWTFGNTSRSHVTTTKTTNGAWQQVQLVSTLPQAGDFPEIRLCLDQLTSGTVWFDDVSLS